MEWRILILFGFGFLYIFGCKSNSKYKIVFAHHRWLESLKKICERINYSFNVMERINCILHFSVQLKIGAITDADRQVPRTWVYKAFWQWRHSLPWGFLWEYFIEPDKAPDVSDVKIPYWEEPYRTLIDILNCKALYQYLILILILLHCGKAVESDICMFIAVTD